MTRVTTSSRRYAMWTTVATFLLTAYCAYKGMEGLGSTVFITGTGGAFALYANKQHQERKIIEATNKNIN